MGKCLTNPFDVIETFQVLSDTGSVLGDMTESFDFSGEESDIEIHFQVELITFGSSYSGLQLKKKVSFWAIFILKISSICLFLNPDTNPQV